MGTSLYEGLDARLDGQMLAAALILTILGGLLAVVGIVWAAVAATRRRDHVEKERGIVLRENETGGDSGERLRQRGVPFTSMADLTTIRQDVELAILTDAVRSLRGPALVVLIGGVLPTIGGVLGLWV